jgi:hypothetical protein
MSWSFLNCGLFFGTGAARAVKSRNFLTDDWILRSFVDVDLRPVRIIFGNIRVREDRFDGTFGNACVAINASVGVDVKTIGQLVKCFNRTNCCAVGVLAIDAQFNNYVGHWGSKLLSMMANSYSVVSLMSTGKIL